MTTKWKNTSWALSFVPSHLGPAPACALMSLFYRQRGCGSEGQSLGKVPEAKGQWSDWVWGSRWLPH